MITESIILLLAIAIAGLIVIPDLIGYFLLRGGFAPRFRWWLGMTLLGSYLTVFVLVCWYLVGDKVFIFAISCALILGFSLMIVARLVQKLSK